jgi:hypothetical protein
VAAFAEGKGIVDESCARTAIRGGHVRMNSRRNQGIAARPGIFIVDGAAVFILSGGSQQDQFQIRSNWLSLLNRPIGDAYWDDCASC